VNIYGYNKYIYGTIDANYLVFKRKDIYIDG